MDWKDLLTVLGLLSAWLLFRSQQERKRRIAFLHPNCDQGGGGERLLWTAVKAIAERYPEAELIIYSTSNAARMPTSSLRILIAKTFGINIPKNIKIIELKTFCLADFRLYRKLVLLMHMLASALVAVEALWNCHPDLLIDSYGFPFVFPFFRLARIRCIAYIHYPWTTHDVINKAIQKLDQSSIISFDTCKYLYYQLMFRAYRLVLKLAAVLLCNSTWTANHLKGVLNSDQPVTTLYPPCDFPRASSSEKDSKLVVSLAQFRPEKRHELQLLVFQKVLQRISDARFILIGGCRNEEDKARVELLKEKALQLGFPPESITFAVNRPVEAVRSILAAASVGVHTMQEEHFGIGVVEMMAAGVVVAAHSSGGPQDDIIQHNEDGFLCENVEEYATKIIEVLEMPPANRAAMQDSAQKSAARFNSRIFSKKLLSFI